MIKGTAVPADVRKKKIADLVALSDLANDPFLRSFGLTILPNLLRFPARVLNAPRILYGQKVSPSSPALPSPPFPFHSHVAVPAGGDPEGRGLADGRHDPPRPAAVQRVLHHHGHGQPQPGHARRPVRTAPSFSSKLLNVVEL